MYDVHTVILSILPLLKFKPIEDREDSGGQRQIHLVIVIHKLAHLFM
jgi:hypothetical protein